MKMTNGEWLRNQDDKTLAEFIAEGEAYARALSITHGDDGTIINIETLVKWLQSEHEECDEEIDCPNWQENKKDKTGFHYVCNVKMTKQEAAGKIADICEKNTSSTGCDECPFFYDNYDECIYKMLKMSCPKDWEYGEDGK